MQLRYGTLDVATFGKSASTINGYKTDALIVKGAQILELHMEIDDDPADALLPRAMHPAIPSYAIFNFAHYPDSPWGEFTIAEVRVAGRTGSVPRAFVLRSYVDSQQVGRELAGRWGFPVAAGEVTLRSAHDRVIGQVKVDDKIILEAEQSDRDLVSGADIQYLASMHLARNRADDKLALVQVDPEYVFSRAERGKPRVLVLDNQAFGAGDALRVTNSVSASFTTADIKLPMIRYICDPELPPTQGTIKVAA
jgi:hypothetical protein